MVAEFVLSSIAIVIALLVNTAEAEDHHGTIKQNGYVSEYFVHCEDRYLTFNEVAAACPNTPGFLEASVPTKGANDLLASFTDEAIWLGAVGAPGGNGYQWSWYRSNRLAAVIFATSVSSSTAPSGKCEKTDLFCNFPDGEPKIYNGKCPTAQTGLALESKEEAKGKDRRYWRVADRGLNCMNTTAKCYACENVSPYPSLAPREICNVFLILALLSSTILFIALLQ